VGGRSHPRCTLGVAATTPDGLWGWLATPNENCGTPLTPGVVAPLPERLSDPPEAFQGWCDHPWPSTVSGRPPQWVVDQPLWGLDLLFLFLFFPFLYIYI
jgi:hypothetical protein